MEAREQRGVELAATRSRSFRFNGNLWSVPSATGDGTRYSVDIEAGRCSCPDFFTRGTACKHIYAVRVISTRREEPDGSVVEAALMTTKRKTYPQNWPKYNAAQRTEKDRFQELLQGLCAGVPARTYKGGRPRFPLPDAIFSATFKVYSTLSSRRFEPDLREAHRRGHISRTPCYNTVTNTLEDDSMTPILRSLVEVSALPLASVEDCFAMDSSGFTTSRYVRWYDAKYGKLVKQHEWVKVHITCGTKTNIVTAVEIGGPNTADTKMLPPMLSTTAKNFNIAEISGDKAYSSKKNLELIGAAGAIPFIAFQESAAGLGGGMWAKMFAYFQFRREEFLAHYHRRSNVETTFSMVKKKFGGDLRSRTDAAMKNETMCKMLCHNSRAHS